IGKFAPETFEDLITDISLFRPGPVKSDMVRPFLEARQGWKEALYVHEDLRYALEQTYGVVVFHEQVLMIVSTMTGCTLAEADGVLTHDPGMYPKRLILDDARQFGIAILSLDVNASQASYTLEKVGFLDEPPPAILGAPPRSRAEDLDLPDGRGHGIRIGLSDV